MSEQQVIHALGMTALGLGVVIFALLAWGTPTHS